MAASRASIFDIRSIGSGTLRLLFTLMVAGLMLSVVATFSGVEALGPTVDAGGGGGQLTIADMLRGAYSPYDVTPEIAVTEVSAPVVSVSDMLRGAYSPFDVNAEIAITEVEAPVTVAEMIRGDLSPV